MSVPRLVLVGTALTVLPGSDAVAGELAWLADGRDWARPCAVPASSARASLLLEQQHGHDRDDADRRRADPREQERRVTRDGANAGLRSASF